MQLNMLTDEDRVPVRLFHDEARRALSALVGIDLQIHALLLELPLKLTHVRESVELPGMLIPARIEGQDVLVDIPWKSPTVVSPFFKMR